MHKHARCGFTQLELLVALSVIGLLMAIVAPAVMRAREASRLTQCRSNLANIGRALGSYEASEGHFPPAVKASARNPHVGDAAAFAPHVRLLPYLEQTATFNQLMMLEVPPGAALTETSLVSPQIREMVLRRLPVFLCPSDSGDFGNNYRVCMGMGPNVCDQCGLSPPTSGAFEILKSHAAGRFRDGLSQTVAMSEKIKSDNDASQFEREVDFWFSGLVNTGVRPADVDQMISVCNALVGDPPDYYAHVGLTWAFGSYAHTWYNHAVPPNARDVDCSEVSSDGREHRSPGAGVYKASSKHAAGVNVLFMDGRVQFISDSIDLHLWRALATRDGNEVAQLPGQ